MTCREKLAMEHPDPEKEPETFHDKLVRTIRDVGQEIIDNAEEYAGKTRYLSRMTIMIDFNPEVGAGGMLMPEINVNKTYLCEKIVEEILNPNSRFQRF